MPVEIKNASMRVSGRIQKTNDCAASPAKNGGAQSKVSPKSRCRTLLAPCVAKVGKTSLLTQAPLNKEGRLLPNDSAHSKVSDVLQRVGLAFVDTTPGLRLSCLSAEPTHNELAGATSSAYNGRQGDWVICMRSHHPITLPHRRVSGQELRNISCRQTARMLQSRWFGLTRNRHYVGAIKVAINAYGIRARG